MDSGEVVEAVFNKMEKTLRQSSNLQKQVK